MKRWVLMSALFVSACDCCVGRGAKVKTPRGERNIEDLGVGDEVIVVDPETLERHVGKLSAIRRAPRECGGLHFGAGSLRVTSSHPLFDPRAKVWAPAGDWLLGVREEFVGVDGPVRVTRAERFVGIDDVFDLSVDHPLHTFVANGVVVHNKPPMRVKCATTADQRTFAVGQACECGPITSTSLGVRCEGGFEGAPFCDCGSEASEGSWWRTDLGSTEDALQDSAYWSSVERQGPREVLTVEPWSPTSASRVVLPGSPNVLRVNETGDGSAGFLVKAPDAGISIGSLWFLSNGVFPRVVSAGDFDLVLFGVDQNSVWFQPPGQPRWVTRSYDPTRWRRYSWQISEVEGGGYQLRPFIGDEWSTDAYPEHFRVDGSGLSLEAFYADGGSFSFGDAGIPTSLRVGHQSATDGGSGALRLTGVTLSFW